MVRKWCCWIWQKRQANKNDIADGSVQETDSRGNIVRVAKKDQDGNLLTKVTYEYNAMGEMLKAFDAKQNPIVQFFT